MKKRVLAVFLATAMVTSVLSGCGNNKEGDSSLRVPVAEEGVVYDGTVKLPLCEEKETLTIFMTSDANFFTIYNDYNQSEFFQEMERRTNVHIEFEVPPSGEETTAFNLMISSGNLTDMICMPYMYPDGMDAAIDDGYYLDLTPYLDTYLYHYNEIRKTNDIFMKNTVTDSGRCAYISILNTEQQGPWVGMQIRQDWLDELGLKTPVTYDDLEYVLTQFKEKKGCYAPLALSSNGNYVFGELSSGFGTTGDFINKNGKVVAGFATDEWRAYLTKMNDWYKKGLIDPDFMTHSPFFVDTELATTGSSGVWYSMYTMASLYELSMPEGARVKALACPKLNEGDTTHIRIADTYIANGGLAINAKSDKAALAMKWVDYLFSDEGAALANYGIEGKTFNFVDGKPVYTDDILNNKDGLSVTQAMIVKALVPSQIPSHYDWTRELVVVSPEDIESYDIWARPDELDDWVMPSGVSLTADENIEYAKYYTDIQTYFKETSLKFISGVLDINSDEWDKYIATLESMNLNRCVEIKQAGLDRYLAR